MGSIILPITLMTVVSVIVTYFVLTGNARPGGSRLDADERAARRHARARRQARSVGLGDARSRVEDWWRDARERRRAVRAAEPSSPPIAALEEMIEDLGEVARAFGSSVVAFELSS